MDFYDMDGQPISMVRWGELLTDDHYARVGFDEIDGTEVSTVWVGYNLNPDLTPPLIFETLTFGKIEGRGDRYTTKEAAVSGHARICEEVRNGQS